MERIADRIAAAAFALMLFNGPVFSQADLLGPEDLEPIRGELNVSFSQARENLKSAQKKMNEFLAAGQQPEEAEINEFFDQVNGEVLSLMEQVKPTSSFVDAMDATRAQLIVLRERYRNAPASQSRDANLAVIESEITKFNATYDQLLSMNNRLREGLIANNRMRQQMIEQREILKVSDLVASLSGVVDSFDEVVEGLVALTSEPVTPVSAPAVAFE